VKTTRRLAWLALPLSLALVAGACGSDDDEDTGSDDAGGEEQDFSGDSINISGSSTVEPITAIVAEEFDATTGATTTVDGPGTGDGFELFCTGETDISDASRPIDEEEEVPVCEENGVEFVEIQVAYDGMAVMTNPNNDEAPECLNFADLYAMVGPESNGFGNWSDGQAIATELGSSTELPDIALELTGPGTESGTYDSFIEIALEDIAEERGQEPTTRSDYESSGDDNIIIQNIESSDTSLGWVGWAYAKEQGDAVVNIPVAAEADGDCVEVSDETISDGSYPLSRPLFIYVNKANAEENPALAAFVDFYLEGLDDWVAESGYVVQPEDQTQTAIDAWEAR
jgi:phosphate transport system substrate-binding protein